MSFFEVTKVRGLSLHFVNILLHHFINCNKNNLKETILLVVSFFLNNLSTAKKARVIKFNKFKFINFHNTENRWLSVSKGFCTA